MLAKRTTFWTLTLLMASMVLMLFGCATSPRPSSAAPSPAKPLAAWATFIIARTVANQGCNLAISIYNETPLPWDGINYHIALRNRDGRAVEDFYGRPLVYIEKGESIEAKYQSSQKCEAIVSASVLEAVVQVTGKGSVSIPTYRTTIAIQPL